MSAESTSTAGPVYYMGQHQDDVAEFKKEETQYKQFKKEYRSAIDATIKFYSGHEVDDNKITGVTAGLNAFKEKLFGKSAEAEQQHILFQAKADMEQIARALTPAEGEPPLGRDDITEKLIAIYNLAGRDETTGEVACLVCASGTARNLADTAQLLASGDLFDNVQIQRRNIAEEIIKQYVLTRRDDIRRRPGGHNHETNLVNAFINAFSEQWGLRSVTELYVNPSIVTAEDRENIDHELRRAVTQDSITDRLATEYLSKIQENVKITGGTIDYQSAATAMRDFAKRYGDPGFKSVFSVDEDAMPVAITKDPTAIKVAIARYFSAENKNKTPPVSTFPLTWSEATPVGNGGTGRQLWRIGDLFWIEQTVSYEADNGQKSSETTVSLPGMHDLGESYINQVGGSQLPAIIRQIRSEEEAAVLSKINPERLNAMDIRELSLFFTAMDPDGRITQALAYARRHRAWFDSLVARARNNPLTYRLSGQQLAKIPPDIALKGATRQQAWQFFAELDHDDSHVTQALAYASQYPVEFAALVARTGENPLTGRLIRQLAGRPPAADPPDIPPDIALQGISAEQARQFFAALDPIGKADNAVKYARLHAAWFTALVARTGENPLTGRLVSQLDDQRLMKLAPDIALQGATRQQAWQFFAALDRDGHITQALAYASRYPVEFATLVARTGENPLTGRLTSQLARRLPTASLPDIPPEIALQGATRPQIRQFFAALDPTGGLDNAVKYITQHQAWFAALTARTGENPLIARLTHQHTRRQLIKLVPDIALQGISAEQARQFFAALDPTGELDNAVKYARLHAAWFTALVARIRENPLAGRLTSQRTSQQLAASQPGIALQGISAEQARQFFAALDPTGGLDNAIKYVFQHHTWFIDLVTRIRENPLTGRLISQLAGRPQLANLPPDIVLQGIGVDQARQFFAALDPAGGLDNAVKYALRHSTWFVDLVARIRENPLTGRLTTQLVGRPQLANLPPDIVLQGISAHQAWQFFAALNRNGGITTALGYASQNRAWFNALVTRTGENPLITVILDDYVLGFLSPESLAGIPPDVALQGITRLQAGQFFSALDNDGSRNNAVRYRENNTVWFQQQGWGANSFLPPLNDNPVLSDIAASDNKLVGNWERPTVKPRTEGGTTRFDGQLIIQLENDAVIREAAENLAAKHPGSVLIQLDVQGGFRVLQGELVNLQNKENLRWQLVGHGRYDATGHTRQTLAGRSAVVLAQQLKQFSTDSGINRPPEHISLVGCSLAGDDRQESYARRFAASLNKDIRPFSVTAYSTQITVSDTGRKRLTETGNKVTLVFSREKKKWDITTTPGKHLHPGDKILLTSVNRAEDFRQAMTRLYDSHALSAGEWLPVLGSLQENNGSHSLLFINREKPELPARTLTTGDPLLVDFIHDYNNYLTDINKTFSYADKTFTRHTNVMEAVNGLNSAFIIYTLLSWFTGQGHSGTLSTALQVHTWVNLTQMTHGALEDGAKLVRLYQAVLTESQEVTRGLLSPLLRISTGTAVVLNIGSVVLDSIELAQAQNETQQAIFGTQLAFDSAALASAMAGAGAEFFGAPTVGAFSGALSVPLVGLGIGVTALARAYGRVADNARAVGSYFADLEAAYQQGGYRQGKKVTADDNRHPVMEPIPGAVIRQLDLRHRRLTFDSQYIYRTQHGRTGSGTGNYFFWAGDKPQMIRDKNQAINIRAGLSHPEEQQLSVEPGNDILILPATPKSYLSYDYRELPFATFRGDRGFDVLRRLEKDYRFDYDFYVFPVEYIISRIQTEYVPTTVEVILDVQDRDIVIPALAGGMQGMLSYQLTGGGGEYRISLQEGVSLSLQADNTATRWILDARHFSSAGKMTLSQDGKLLHIGNMRITLSEAPCGTILLIDNRSNVFSVDRQRREITVAEVDAGRFNSLADLHDYLRKLTNQGHHNNPFVALDHYQPPAATGPVGRAFYETGRDRIIYTNRPEAAEFLSQAELVKVEGDKAWFCRDATLWQVDIASGAVLRQYLPLKFPVSDKGKISSHIMQGDGMLWLMIVLQRDESRMSHVYQVEETALKLVAVDGDEAWLAAAATIKSDDHRINLPPVNQWSTTGDLTTPEHQIKASLAEVVSISGKVAGVNTHGWFLTDGEQVQMVRMNLADQVLKDTSIPTGQKESNPEGLTLREDFALVFVTTGDKPGYYFYSYQRQLLYFQPDRGLSGTLARPVAVDNIRYVFVVNRQLVVLTAEGTLWLADNRGAAWLTGVTADWLYSHQENLIAQLSQLIRNTASRFSSLQLYGLRDSRGKPVRGWYDSAADQAILAGPGLSASHSLTYLSLTADKKQAWIFDNNSQQLYRQRLNSTAALTFSETGTLSRGVMEASPWSDQKYLSAIYQGDRLRLETQDGALLLLSVEAGITDRPVLIAWRTKGRPDMQITSAIESVRDEAELPQAVRLLSEPGQPAAWYLPAERKIRRATGGPDAAHFLHYLGQVAGRNASYIHDQTSGKLWSVSETQSAVVGNYRFVDLEQGCLVLQVGLATPGEQIRLPQLTGIDRLAITGLTEASSYCFSDPAMLAHYREVVLDDRGKNSIIQFPDTDKASFSLQRNGQDLVLYHQESDTRIWVVNIEQAALRGMKLEIGSSRLTPEINSLMKRMDRLTALMPDGSSRSERSPGAQPTDFSAGRDDTNGELIAAAGQLPEAMATFRSSGEGNVRPVSTRFPIRSPGIISHTHRNRRM